MQHSEQAEPKHDGPRVKLPPAPLPEWMKDRSLLPKKPPSRSGPK